jgi:hypothetical protein
MLRALADALEARWVAPPGSVAPIRECNLSWKGKTIYVNRAVAAFRPRQTELCFGHQYLGGIGDAWAAFHIPRSSKGETRLMFRELN